MTLECAWNMQVSRALQRRERRRAGLGSSQREEADIRRKRRTNRMLIAMVAIFMCCWLPLNVVLMAINYFPAIRGANADIIFFVAHIIAMSSTMYNLFLYGWMNDGFRKVRTIIKCDKKPAVIAKKLSLVFTVGLNASRKF